MSFGVPTGAVGSAVQAGRELFSLLLPARIEGLEKASSRFFIEPEHEKTRQDAYALCSNATVVMREFLRSAEWTDQQRMAAEHRGKMATVEQVSKKEE